MLHNTMMCASVQQSPHACSPLIEVIIVAEGVQQCNSATVKIRADYGKYQAVLMVWMCNGETA